MGEDDKDDSDIDAGSRGPKAKGKAKAFQDDDAFEDGAPKRKGAPSGPKDASDQYQKVCSKCNDDHEAPLTPPRILDDTNRAYSQASRFLHW
jgi:hypothetical protein